MAGFLSPLKLEYLDGREWRVDEPFEYHIGSPESGMVIQVRAGFKTDFASVPRFFWRIFPPTGTYGKAAVIHDHLYRTALTSRAMADAIFLEAMGVLRVVRWKRWTMYLAVRLFGWAAYTGSPKTLSQEAPAVTPTRPRKPQRPDFSEAAPESLQTQLTELNTRGRHYGSQLWHVPFAYVGIVGAVMSQVVDKGDNAIFLALVVSSIFGIPALLHVVSLLDGNKRAVFEIQRVEDALGLPQTAEYKSRYVRPLLGLVVLTMIVCAVAAIAVQMRLSGD